MIEEGFVGAGLASMRRILVTVEVYTGDTSECSVPVCDGSFAMGSRGLNAAGGAPGVVGCEV
jgi:hypothetical protein